jgi:hypothetical protein
MIGNTRTVGGTALAVLAAGLLMSATPSLAQYQGSQPAAGAPATAQPGSAQPGASQPGTAQPSGTMDQTNPGSATMPAQPSSSNSSTISASAGEPLSKVKDAKTTLASASVQDSSGQPIGQVANVHTTKKGTATKIDVTLQSAAGGQAKTVSIKASQLHYDSSSNTLKADLTSSDVQALPAASSM